MKLVIFFILLFPVVKLPGQDKMPGGVRGALIWQITEPVKQNQALWVSRLGNSHDTTIFVRGRIRIINNNPALLFAERPEVLNASINLGELSAFSLFTVCQENDTISERIIFSLENDSAAEMVLTGRRMAALDICRYANFTGEKGLFPKIYSYTQNKTNDTVTLSRRLQFGRPPRTQHLPVSAFNGIIPEVILFPRFITPVERQKVESYLALKYGISLAQLFPVSYLNSSGDIIWDAEIHSSHHMNITGIGRDDISGLYQKISENTKTPGVMKIAAEGELKNNCFLVWGDNGKPLRFAEEPALRKMLREWKISSFNFSGNPVTISTDELSINEIDPLYEGETYWLMIDKSGTGTFPFGKTEYKQSLPLTPQERLIKFNSLVIDSDFSGSDLFTLLAAPRFFTRNIVKQPSCSESHSGLIQTEIAGGRPPFQIILQRTSDDNLHIASNVESRHHIFGNIQQGSYIIRVTDAENNTFTENLWISNSRLWENKIQRNYRLTEGQTVVLNASDGMPDLNYLYSWILPDGSSVNNEEISINRPGNYLLSVTDENNCNSTVDIKVSLTGNACFKHIELFPNPVRGWFAVRISLNNKMNVNVVISDMTGSVLKQTLLKNDQYYLYNDIIQLPGIYYITLVTETERETIKLIVQ
jgi:hypothetical protein